MDVAKWLALPWWAGVQGIASVLGVIAIIVAVADFIIRSKEGSPDAISLHVAREPSDGNTTITATFRVMGSHVMYEPEYVVWGLPMNVPLPELPPRIDVHAGMQEAAMFSVPDSIALDDVRVGVAWVIPQRRMGYAAVSRTTVGLSLDYERWVRWEWYQWPWWPRQAGGRWRPTRTLTSHRSRLYFPRE